MAPAEHHLAELEEVWALVDELGDLSVRLRKAADAAVIALNPDKSEDQGDD